MPFFMNFVPPPAPQTLMEALTASGLTANLKIALDAGDAASWPGSGTKWLDTSGNGYDFFLGADGSATATDPTFNGASGGKSASEYWGFDGGDYFTYDSANEAWMETLHKDNAIFSFCCWISLGTAAATQVFWATNSTTSDVGCLYRTTASGFPLFLVGTASPSIIDTSALGPPTDGTWAFLGMSIDESIGASGAFHYFNGSVETWTSTFNGPSASSALGPLRSGATVGAGSRLTSGSRLAQFAMWQGAKLSTADFDAIYAATRTRFGV